MRCWRPAVSIVAAVAAAVLAGSPLPASAAPTAPAAAGAPLASLQAEPAEQVVDYSPEAEPSDEAAAAPSVEKMKNDLQSSTPAPPTNLALSNALAAGVTVSYSPDFPSPPEVQQVVEAAVSRWTDTLDTGSAPIQVEVLWYPFGNATVLASSGFTTSYRGGPLPTARFIPAPLANVMTGSDLNGPGSPEIQVVINSSVGSSWYINTGGSVPSTQLDLYSVLLHELGHGFGFVGSASSTNGAPPAFPAVPLSYDDFVTYDNQPLLAQADPASLLTSGNLFFDEGPGGAFKLFAPNPWQQGSSYSHFDEATYTGSAPGTLMTPSLRRGEVQHTIDAAVTGVMHEIGWNLRPVNAGPVEVSGRALDQNGRGVTGVIVDLLVSAGNGVPTTWLKGTITGTDGSYSFTAAPGCYILVFTAADGTVFPDTGHWHELEVCPGAERPSTGNNVTLEVTVTQATTGTVNGTITAPDGTGAPGSKTDLLAANADGSPGAYVASRTSDGTGQFSYANRAFGCYVVVLAVPSLSFRWVDGDQWIERFPCLTPASPVANLTAALRPAP